MDIIEKLIDDHNKLKKVMSELEAVYEKDNVSEKQEELFKKFKKLYYNHSEIEEDVVYPAFEKYLDLEKLILKGYQAHHVVDVGLLELKLLPYSSTSWFPKFLIIKDSILMHMNEEEKEVFSKAKKSVKQAELEILGKKVQAMSLNKDE